MYDYFCHLLFYHEYSLFVILWQQNLVVFNQIKKGKRKYCQRHYCYYCFVTTSCVTTKKNLLYFVAKYSHIKLFFTVCWKNSNKFIFFLLNLFFFLSLKAIVVSSFHEA